MDVEYGITSADVKHVGANFDMNIEKSLVCDTIHVISKFDANYTHGIQNCIFERYI